MDTLWDVGSNSRMHRMQDNGFKRRFYTKNNLSAYAGDIDAAWPTTSVHTRAVSMYACGLRAAGFV